MKDLSTREENKQSEFHSPMDSKQHHHHHRDHTYESTTTNNNVNPHGRLLCVFFAKPNRSFLLPRRV